MANNDTSQALRAFVRRGAERFYPRTGQRLPATANGAGVFLICCQAGSDPAGQIRFSIMEVGHAENMADVISAYAMHEWHDRCTGEVFFYLASIKDQKERATLAQALKAESTARNG